MTFHVIDKETGRPTLWVAVPLEFADWIGENHTGEFAKYITTINPYKDVLIPKDTISYALSDLPRLKDLIGRAKSTSVPSHVEQYGKFGKEGAIKTIDEISKIFAYSVDNDCKIVSIGD